MRAVRVCVTVDVEEEWDWAAGFPTRPATVANVAHLPRLQAVVEGFGGSVTYFANHAAFSDPAAADVLRGLAERPGVEVGLHIHPWNTPPVADTPMEPVRRSFLHTLPPAEQVAKLDAALAAARAAGFGPTSFRGGRYSTGPVVRDWLRSNRFTADSSVLPYTTWPDDGAPDYRRRGPHPTREATAAGVLWDVPLTLGFTRRPFTLWGPVVRAVGAGVCRRLGGADTCWLNVENPHYVGGERHLGTLVRAGLPCLIFTLHSGSLRPGGSPYCRTPADADATLGRLADGLQAAKDCQPATVAQIVSHLEAGFHARHRHQPAG
jgi:hypothetical protein